MKSHEFIPEEVEGLILDKEGHHTSWNQGRVNTSLKLHYSFKWSESVIQRFDDNIGKIEGFTSLQKSLQREAMQRWSNVANISFVEVNGGVFEIDKIPNVYMYAKNRYSWEAGWTYSKSYYICSNNEALNSVLKTFNLKYKVETNPRNFNCYFNAYQSALVFNNFYAANLLEAFRIHLHETGHVIKLQHPFERKGTEIDNTVFSVMNYNTFERYVTKNYFGFDESHYHCIMPISPSIRDIEAVQYLYGQSTVGSGNTQYNLTGHANFASQLLMPTVLDAKTLETIWDPDGNDTLSTQGMSEPVQINLNAGTSYRTIFGKLGCHEIILSGLFENVVVGSGPNEIILNAEDNIVDLRAAEKKNTIITNTQSGGDILLGFKSNQDQIIIEVPYVPNLSSSINATFHAFSKMKFLNETLPATDGSMIQFNDHHWIAFPGIASHELSQKNIIFKTVTPSDALYRRHIISNDVILPTEVMWEAGGSALFGFAATLADHATRYIVKDKLKWSALGVQLASLTVRHSTALLYNDFSPACIDILAITWV